MNSLPLVLIIISFFAPNTYYYEKAETSDSRAIEQVIEADITKYAWTGNVMANGEYPHIGAVASSDRDIPLGTVVEIKNKEYVVKDRTAKWVHEEFGTTFDIYSEETEEEMLKFGRQKQKVIVKR